ncbi:hypothetical protein, partial [Helicobacter pylori]|uniref:hypothetical protein n=1 Tax=Helicobacter pylori TaxID=210 RepID=UPI0036F20642
SCFLFNFIIDYILVLYFSVAFFISFIFSCFGLGFYCFIQRFLLAFCLSFFIVFNGLITRIGMFYFVLYSITIFSFLGFYPYIISAR